jgi:hypothetical protein
MTALRLLQKRFASALLDAERPTPPEVAAAGRRFAVYRNNVRVSLTDALVARFPLCHTLVGDAFFRAMAARFIELCPPRSPILSVWGDELPEFIELFPPASGLPYLADCARLEVARTEAYHAADVTPLAPAALAAVAPEEWGDARLTLHPSVRVIASWHPVGSIWRMHVEAADPPQDWPAEDVLVARPFSDVVVSVLPRGGAAFVEALASLSVGGASEHVARRVRGFDLKECLPAVVSRRLVVATE